MSKFLSIPASCRSPSPIMSSTPCMDVACMALIRLSGESQCSSPSSSLTAILRPSAETTFAPMATSNSLPEMGSIQM